MESSAVRRSGREEGEEWRMRWREKVVMVMPMRVEERREVMAIASLSVLERRKWRV